MNIKTSLIKQTLDGIRAHYLERINDHQAQIQHIKSKIACLDEVICDLKFETAGHKPAEPGCTHVAWNQLPQPRPRHCPACGTCMWDPVD